MTENNSNSFVHTNVGVFYKIAKETYKTMKDDLDSSIRPKPGGEPGSIITYDYDQKSFKNAFITIVFCGVWLESILHLRIVKCKGVEVFNEYDRKSYEAKLQLLGCNDESIIKLCKYYREARREVIHEKAYLDQDSHRAAQKEAEKAIELVDKVCNYFKLKFK